jgi:alpha-L-rhamnosidase
MRANFLEVPTDCPQRDERLGWTGDAQVFIRTAIGNADVEAFFRKWLNDLADAQHASGGIANIVPTRKHSNEGDAAWADALTVCPTTLYRCYGDREQLAEWLPRMQAYLTHLDQAIGEDGVRQGPHCFGDWLALDGNMEEWWSGGATPKPLIQTAFYAYDCRLVAEALRELGEHALAETYTAKARATAEAFRRAFVDEEGRLKGDSQTGYVLALHFDLLPEELRAKALTHLCRNIETHERHLTTGFVGVSYLLPTLARFGRLDLAYTLLENETYPSWGYSIANGATTIWERWNGWKKAEGVGDANMNSYSHYAYGSVGEFLHATVAGLDVIEPGFRTARIAPKPGGSLTHASFAYDSIMGRYVAAWRKTESGYAYRIEVPANCRALCELPLGTAAMLVEGGVELPQVPGVSEVRVEDGVLHCELGSGSYSFEPVA